MVEAFLVAFIFGLIQLCMVFVALNLKFIAGEFRRELSHLRDLNDSDWIEAFHPLLFNSKLSSHFRLRLQILQHHMIVRRIRWYTCNHSGSFDH